MNINLENQSSPSQINSTPQEIGYKKILVGVDYQNSTREIFGVAMNLATVYKSKLKVFHSVQGELPGVPIIDGFSTMGVYGSLYNEEVDEFYEEAYQKAIEKLENWLKSFTIEAREKNIEADSDYFIGDPGKNICKMAQEWNADLVVIGRRGRSGVSELLLGSVSNYVVHNAHCCVLVVQH